jgi:ATP-dependent Clp protease protease subunit
VDIEIQAREIQRIRDLQEEVLAARTGQPRERIARDADRDFILTAAEATAYGLIDGVLSSRRAQEATRLAEVA